MKNEKREISNEEILQYNPLIERIARQTALNGWVYEDIKQELDICCWKALEDYDAERFPRGPMILIETYCRNKIRSIIKKDGAWKRIQNALSLDRKLSEGSSDYDFDTTLGEVTADNNSYAISPFEALCIKEETGVAYE